MEDSMEQVRELEDQDQAPKVEPVVENLPSSAEPILKITSTTTKTSVDQALEPEAPLPAVPAATIPEEMVEEERSISYFLDDDDDDDDEVDPNQAINYFPDDDDDEDIDASGSLPSELIQSELAKRLKVHPSTVAKFRSKANFKQWTKSKDPDSLAWTYVRKTKMYVVVND
ncbi:MAG: hypothetical protein HC796_00560 [Synechococcaceae cyanobacterium RL_1_2]|nr:hypothetical protein [Synechococcaceae cyanobacterium RL_1_2]